MRRKHEASSHTFKARSKTIIITGHDLTKGYRERKKRKKNERDVTIKDVHGPNVEIGISFHVVFLGNITVK